MRDRSWNAWPVVVWSVLLLIVLLTFSLRVAWLNDTVIDHDEEWIHANMLDRSPWRILLANYEFTSHTLALFLARISTAVLSDTLFSLRYPSVCLSVLCVVLVFKLGTKLFDRRVGLLAAFLLALSPYAVFYAHNYRAYSGMMFYVLLAYYLALRAVRKGHRAYWIGVAVFMGLAVYNHLHSALAWVGLFWLVFLGFEKQRKNRRENLRRLGIALAASMAGIAVAYVPLGFRFLRSLFGNDAPLYPMIHPQVPGSLQTSLSWFSGVGLEGMNRNPFILYILTGLCLVSVVLGLLGRRSGQVIALVGWLFFPFVIFEIFRLLVPGAWSRPQYFGFTLPFFLLLAADAPSEIGRFLAKYNLTTSKIRTVTTVLLVAVVSVFWVPPLQEIYTGGTEGNWTDVGTYLASNLQPTDLVLCEPFEHGWGDDYTALSEVCQRNVSYWIRAREVGSIYPVLPLGEASTYDSIAANLQAAARFSRVWVVVFGVPESLELSAFNGVMPVEWDQYGRTFVLQPPADTPLIDALEAHLEYLSSLPHTPETRLTHHAHLAQLAAAGGQPERAQEEWLAARDLVPEVPESEAYLVTVSQIIDQPAMLQSPQHLLQANLGEAIRFEGFSLFPETDLKPGDVVHLTLFWRALQRPVEDYTVFVHVNDGEGNRIYQDDFQPSPNTAGWWPGDLVWNERTISIPVDVQVGQYSIYAGMYRLETLERLPVSGQASQDDSLQLTTLNIG